MFVTFSFRLKYHGMATAAVAPGNFVVRALFVSLSLFRPIYLSLALLFLSLPPVLFLFRSLNILMEFNFLLQNFRSY